MRFLITALLFLPQFLIGQTSISPLDCVEPFYHGVASGDPLSDRVIIWTRVTPSDFTQTIDVKYRVATDTAMTNIVKNGVLTTDGTKDFTVKVDIIGLSPDTYYYYEFEALESNSARGRTKTAPVGNIDSLRFAIVSCANLESGYFNVYEALYNRNDFEAVLMLGDYMYEYETGGYGQDSGIDRIHEPETEILSLDDYRLRYSVYHMDRSLQKLHQNFPWICVWDDHESANDSYKDGAENHNAGEGDWETRKGYAQQAYFEWLPIRAKAPENREIFRSFDFGNLVHLAMVDTRLHGRDEQGVNESSPNRTLLGHDQYSWLENDLLNSNAQYNILGNQVIVAPLEVFGNPINNDQWDGYPAERGNLLNFLDQNNISNFTVITGDIHTSWAFELENGNNHVGVEFVTPSVTSPSTPLNVGGVLALENPHMKYVELTKKGFIILDINSSRIQSDWYYVNTISEIDASNQWAKSFYSASGTNQLTETNNASSASTKYDITLAPECPRPYEAEDTTDVENTSSIEEKQEIGLIGIYPNPAKDKLSVHFIGSNFGIHNIRIIDLNGKIALQQNVENEAINSSIKQFSISDLKKGMYILQISDEKGNKVVSKFLKN